MQRSAPLNMAIDELIFDQVKNEPVLRIYFWDKPYTTIGYFQNNGCNAVRRLTGGLLVNHQHDLSYSFCAAADKWPYLYSQQETYKHIHEAMKKALSSINIKSDFAKINQSNEKNILCVQTLYSDDLMFGGKKIVGSCMRRRGKKILVQGSLHLALGHAKKKEFSCSFAKNIAELINDSVRNKKTTQQELEQASVIAAEKYSNRQWNNKF